MGILEVSFSKIKLWRSCRKAYSYRYDEHLKKKAPAVPLLRGSIIGEMLDARAIGKDPLKVLEKYEKEYRKLFLEEQEMYGDLIGDLRRIIAGYNKVYANEKLTYLGIELEVRTKLTPTIEFHGYIDKLVQDNTKVVWDMDHKSHGNIPDEDARYSDIQQVLYVDIYNRSASKKKQATGVIWDYIRTKPPTIPEQLKNGELTKRKNIDTTYDVYLEEVKRLNLNPDDYKEILDMLQKQPNQFFQRVKLPANNNQMVRDVVADVVSTAEEIQYVTSKKDYRPVRNMGRGCTFCDFFELCQTELRGYDSSFIRKTRYVTREERESAQETK